MKTTLNKMLYRQLSAGLQVTDISREVGANVFPGYRLIRVDGRAFSRSPQGFEIAMVSDTTESVVYYSRVIVFMLGDLEKPATHSLTWRSPNFIHQKVLEQLSSKVLFNYILEKHYALLSDGNQTSGGRFFWQSQISSALAKGRCVYSYKRAANELELVPDQEAFEAITEQIWGDSWSHEQNLMLISNECLPSERRCLLPVDLIGQLCQVDVAEPYIEEPMTADRH